MQDLADLCNLAMSMSSSSVCRLHHFVQALGLTQYLETADAATPDCPGGCKEEHGSQACSGESGA